MHGSTQLSCNKQWSKVRRFSGKTRPFQSCKGNKYGYTLRLLGGHKLSERQLRMQREMMKKYLEQVQKQVSELQDKFV